MNEPITRPGSLVVVNPKDRTGGCVFVCYVKDEEKRFYNHANDKTIVSQLWRVLSVYSSGHTSSGQTYPLRQVMGMFMEFEVVP